jgi:hypothetical protein
MTKESSKKEELIELVTEYGRTMYAAGMLEGKENYPQCFVRKQAAYEKLMDFINQEL